MASLNLNAAVEVVTLELLQKQLRIVELLDDLLCLIEVRLRNIMFYVEIDGEVSSLFDINCALIQGAIIGSVLYAIYVSPLFNIAYLSNFTNDNYALTWNKNKESTVNLMGDILATSMNWLIDSGLKVNKSKTELCLFYHRDIPLYQAHHKQQ